MVCSLGIGRMEVMARFLAAGSFSQTIADDFGRSAAEYICRELREADEANLLDEEGVFGSVEGEGLLYWHHLGHMLMIVDNEEFYEHERPLSLKDIRSLIIILRQALWHLLWVNHTTNPNSLKSASANSASKRQSVEAIQQRVSTVVSELLSQIEIIHSCKIGTTGGSLHPPVIFMLMG